MELEKRLRRLERRFNGPPGLTWLGLKVFDSALDFWNWAGTAEAKAYGVVQDVESVRRDIEWNGLIVIGPGRPAPMRAL